MKSTLLLSLVLVASLALPLFGSDSPAEPDRDATDFKSETLADAVARINSEVERDCGILSPTPITVSKVKAALKAAANEVAESDIPEQASYVNTLTQIAASGQIPKSVHFYFTPITGRYSAIQKAQSRDGRHVSISLNYVLEVQADQGRRLIGLTQIVETFQVIKPQEQREPFEPPKP